MKNSSLSFILILILLSTVCACKKDAEVGLDTNLLINKKWQITDLQTQPKGGAVTDVTSSIESCHTDDLFVFKADGTYILYSGENDCDGAYPDIHGTWTFSNPKLTLTDEFGEDYVYTVTGLSALVLKYHESLAHISGSGQVFEYTNFYTLTNTGSVNL